MPARVMRNQGAAAPQGPPPQTGYMNPPPSSSSGHEGMHMQQQQQHYPQGNNNSSGNNNNTNGNNGMGSSAAGGGGVGNNNNNANNGGGNTYNDQRMPSSYNHAYGMGSAGAAGGGGAGGNNNTTTTNNNQSAPMHTPNPPPPPPGNMGMGGPQNLPPPPNVYQQGGNHNNNSNTGGGGAMGSGMNVGAMPYNAGNMLPPPPQGGWGGNNAGGGNMMYGGGMGMQNAGNEYNNNNSGGSGNGSGEYGMGGAGPHTGAGGGGANYMPPPPPQGQGYGGPQQQGQSLNNSRRMRTPCPPPSPNMSLPPPPLQPPPLTQGPPPPPPPQPSYYNPNVPPTPSSMSGYNTGGNNNTNNGGMGGGGGNYGNNNNNNNGGGGNHYRVNTNAGSLMHGDSASSYGGPLPPSMQSQVLQPGYLREDSSTYGPGGTELTNSPPSQPQSQPSPSRGGNYGNYGPLPPPPHMQQLAPSQPAMMNRGYDNGGNNYGGMMNSGGGNNNNNKSNNNMGGNMNMNANYMGGYGGNSEMRGGQSMYGGPHHGNPNVMAPPSANLSPGGRMHPAAAAPNNRVSSPGMMSSGTGAGMMSPQPQSAPPVGPPNNSNSNSMIMGGHNAGGMDWAGGAAAGPQGQPQMQPMYNNNNNNNAGGGNGTHMNSPSSNMGGGNGNAMMPPPLHHPQQQQPPPPPPPQSPSGNMTMANRSGMRGNNTHHHGGSSNNNNMGGQYKSNSTHGMMSGAPNALMPPNMQLPLISPTQQPPPPPPQAQPPQPLMGGGPQGMPHQGPQLPQQQQGGPSMHYGAGYGGNNNNNNSTAPSPQHYMNNANSNMHHPTGGQGHMNHYGNANLSSGAAAGGGGNGSVMNSMPNSVSNSMYMDPTLALPPPQMQMNNGTLNMSIPDTPIYDEGTPETVTTFYEFLKERGLLRTGTLHDFLPEGYDFGSDGPLKIGIDANYTMNSLRARLQEYDPLWFLHSWLPDQLLMLVRESVLDMRRRNLEPVWVFNGIGVSSDVETLLPSGEELIARNEVWRKLTDGELPARKEIEDAFDTSLSISEDVLMAVQRFLRSELNVLAVTAPFLNWCQLATFHKEGDVQLLMAAPEMLIVPYEPMRLIVEIDLASEKVAYFDRDEVLRELFPHQVRGDDTRAAGNRLLDFGLLTATHPAITAARAATTLTLEKAYEELVLAQQRFGTMRELITFYGMGEGLDRTRQGSEPLKHAKGRTYIQYSAVFSKSFKDCPLVYFRRVLDPSLTNAHMPHNLSGVFGDLVPLALFYFQFVGLLSVSLMTILTQSYFRDEFPISDSEDYHYHLPVLGALRGQIVYQIVLKIKNIVYRAHLDRISWVRWFDSILASVVQPKDTIILDEWYLHHLPVLDRFTDYNLDRITIATVLAVNATTCCVPPAELMANDTGRQAPILYHGKKETYMAVLMKVFDFLGYFTHPVPPKKELGNFLAASSSNNNNNNSNANSSHNAAGQQVNDGYGGGPSAELGDNAGNEMYANNNSGMEMMMPQSSQHSLPRDDSELHEEKNFTHYLARSLECCPESFQTALVRLTELARVQIINAAPCHYVRVNTPGMAYMPSRNDADEAPEVLLATRVACLVSLPYRSCEDGEEFEWAPVYSRHLCAFSVMVRAMNRNLHELVEAVTASVFLSGYSDCELRDFTDLIPLLPFGDLPSSIGGLLLHYVLVFPADYEKNCNTPEERCEYLQCKFKSIPNVTRQLRTVMEFTFHALFLINAYIVHVPIVARAPSLNQTTVVTDTLNLLHEKWRLHLDGPAPEDVHELWRPEV